MMHFIHRSAIIAALAPFLAVSASAQTATDTIGVSLTVQAECTLSADDLAFGTTGLIDTNIDIETALTVECTAGSPYAIGLSAGAGENATVSDRHMTHATLEDTTASYQLFQDTDRQTNWGETAGVDTVDSTPVTGATGAPETITVYGRVPAGQNIPTGDYTDIVTATIWYGTGL